MNINKKARLLFVVSMIIACNSYGMSKNELSSLSTEELRKRADTVVEGVDFSSATRDILISLLSGQDDRIEVRETDNLLSLNIEELQRRAINTFGPLDFSSATRDNLISLLSGQDDKSKVRETEKERSSIISHSNSEYEESLFSNFLKKSLEIQENILENVRRGEENVSHDLFTRMGNVVVQRNKKQEELKKQEDDTTLCKRENISLDSLDALKRSIEKKLVAFGLPALSRSQVQIDHDIFENEEFKNVRQDALKRNLEETELAHEKEKFAKVECNNMPVEAKVFSKEELRAARLKRFDVSKKDN